MNRDIIKSSIGADKMNKIEQLASEILDNYWNLMLPVDVHNIAQSLGITIKKTNNLPDGYIGKLDRKKMLSISQGLDHHSERFLIAQTIGQIVLGHDFEFEDFELKSFGSVFIPESESGKIATEFTYYLLLPKRAIMATINLNIEDEPVNSITGIAKVFDVSFGIAGERKKMIEL